MAIVTRILADEELHRLVEETDDLAKTVTLRREPKPGTPDANADTLRARAEAALAAMQAHIDRGTFTNAQRDAALLLCLRVNVALVRLTLNRLEAT